MVGQCPFGIGQSELVNPGLSPEAREKFCTLEGPRRGLERRLRREKEGRKERCHIRGAYR